MIRMALRAWYWGIGGGHLVTVRHPPLIPPSRGDQGGCGVPHEHVLVRVHGVGSTLISISMFPWPKG